MRPSNFNLERTAHLIYKEPTYMAPNPMEDQRQLSLTIYKMLHGCSLKVTTEMFWVSQSFATKIFNNDIKCMVLTLYYKFVCLARTEADSASERKGFI